MPMNHPRASAITTPVTQRVKRDISLSDDRRFSTPPIVDQPEPRTLIEMNQNTAYQRLSTRHSLYCNIVDQPEPDRRIEGNQRRRAYDTLPSLPTATEDTDIDDIYDVPDFPRADVSTNEEPYEDTVILEQESLSTRVEQPPPVPPKKLKEKRPPLQDVTTVKQATSSEDEEGYIMPTLEVFTAAPESLGSEDSYVFQSIPEEPPTIPLITYSRDREESPIFSMDATEHASLLHSTQDCIPLGNDLSSLEPPSPCASIAPNVAAEQLFNFFLHQNAALHSSSLSLSPVHESHQNSGSTQKREPLKESIQDELGIHTSENAEACAAINTPVSATDTVYDKLEHWRNVPGSKSGMAHLSPSQQISTSPLILREGSTDSSCMEFGEQPDPLQIQTYMLQKIQQALEAIQTAYTYNTASLQQPSSPARQDKLQQSKNTSDSDKPSDLKVVDSACSSVPDISVSPVHSKPQLPEPQVLMQQCLSEFKREHTYHIHCISFYRRAAVQNSCDSFQQVVSAVDILVMIIIISMYNYKAIILHRLVTGEEENVIPPELKKLARANSGREECIK